ncbi:PQQ-binding-like beta-propeller repeat protein [Streptomyces sp. 3MP-14]|uniref:PQQ-binding-like beta-propeller repeat protein n=1 Tax=Streptomyces mimosae TaxID=2586635 RepID=A0A5N6AT46_9ACTN|nr:MULTISPECIES: WD40 repeat domain-containing protein [Streptomyces]KAB8171090.1 PQQ-binding-like beta-propeller repeat protein [Streptomyces mimosae]KAB8179558.1 PQQ-binding-like beta-propeller repeat protein [Streptomyces sp. 3MP-14]
MNPSDPRGPGAPAHPDRAQGPDRAHPKPRSPQHTSGAAPEAVARALLAARPSEEGWWEICRQLERMTPEGLAAIRPAALRWPAAHRPMPDRWWAQWTSGDVRPHHALAGTRALGRLDHVETGTVPYPVAEDWAEDRDDDRNEADGRNGDGPGHPWGTGPGGVDPASPSADPAEVRTAYFYNGASAVAAPAGLRWLALAAAAEWHHNGGDIARWETTRDAPLVWYLDGSGTHDESYDLQLSPDGAIVVAAVEGAWRAWSAATGEPLWRVRPHAAEEAADAEELTFDPEDVEVSMDDLVRFGFSADGRRLAVGTGSSDVVAVLASHTGEVLLRVPEGEDAFGPVALDATGELLAHTGPAGRVVLRSVPEGRVLAVADTGLSSIAALVLAPGGDELFVVGGAVGGVPERAGLATTARPAGRRFTLRRDGGRAVLTGQPLLRPEEFTEGLDADSPSAAITARACWTPDGPFAFVGADFGSLLFDGEGRTLWADPAAAVGAFTPDGRALVVVQEDIDVWFLAGLERPEEPAPAEEPAPGRVLLTGLPPALAGPVAAGDGRPAELPCSHWSVRVAAVADGARALAFCAKLDRDSVGRPQVLCRWPAGTVPGQAPPETGLLPEVDGSSYLSDLAFSPTGEVLARGLLGDESALALDEVAGGATRWVYTLPPVAWDEEERLRIAFSADGSRVVLAAHVTGRVVVLDVSNGKPLLSLAESATQTVSWRGARIDMAALDATGERVAFGVRDAASRVVVREVGGPAVPVAAPAGLRQVTGLAFAPDGRTLAVAGATQRGHAGLWRLALDGEPGEEAVPPVTAVRDLPMHDQPDGQLVWSATGPRAYFPGSHGWGAVWDAGSGQTLAEIPFGCADGGVALSPDGGTLVTVTQFGARLWPLPAP